MARAASGDRPGGTRHANRAALAIAIAAVFVLIWANGAVGIIGSEDNPANRMYVGVVVVALIGALIARLRPEGMAFVLVAMAVVQALIAAIAIIGGLGLPTNGPLKLAGINGFFIALFLASAWLFRRASLAR